MFLKILQISQETPVWNSPFNEAADQARNVIKKRIPHRCISLKSANFLRTLYFTEHIRWLLLLLLKQRSKNEKMYSFAVNIFTGKRQWECLWHNSRRLKSFQFYRKVKSSQIFFVKFVKFYRISLLAVCLGSPQRAVSKIFKIIKVEGNIFCGWGRRNE